jgi:hypothetical protein
MSYLTKLQEVIRLELSEPTIRQMRGDPATRPQQKIIWLIQQHCPYRFHGRTKWDAYKFISKYIGFLPKSKMLKDLPQENESLLAKVGKRFEDDMFVLPSI